MAAKRSTRPAQRVLAVATSTPEYATVGYRTGLWLGEFTHFFDVLTEAGHEVVLASTEGGRVPIDPESLSMLVLKQGGTHKRYADRAFMDQLDHTPTLRDVADQPFDAIYLAGGHGAMFDFPACPDLARLILRLEEEQKVVAAVCHGPAGFLGVQRADGRPYVEGRTLTGFSWPEEKLAGRADAVPFRLDAELTKQGASYTKALRPLATKVVVDERLVTGQNPASAEGVAKAVVKLLATT